MERSKLRVLINTYVTGTNLKVVLFGKDGKVISNFEISKQALPTNRPSASDYNDIRSYSFTDIIKGAYKIYETDEDSHPNEKARERKEFASSISSKGLP